MRTENDLIRFPFAGARHSAQTAVMQSPSVSHKSPTRREWLKLSASCLLPLSSPPAKPSRIQVGLDVGATKIAIAVVEHLHSGSPRILAVHTANFPDIHLLELRKDEALLSSILEKALLQAERMSGVMIHQVHLGMAGVCCHAIPAEWFDRAFHADTSGVLHPVKDMQKRCAFLYDDDLRWKATIRCLSKHRVQIAQTIWTPAASALAVTLGTLNRSVLVLDLGSSSTHYAILHQGHFTCMDGLGAGTHVIPDKGLHKYATLFRLIHHRAKQEHPMTKDILLAGGGVHLPGVMDTVRSIFGSHAIEAPLTFPGNKGRYDPVLACALGLALWNSPPHAHS